MKFLLSPLYLLFAAALLAQTSAQTPGLPTPMSASKDATGPDASARVASLHFLAGHWEGHVDDARIEQTCSIADPAVLVCMFRLMGEKGTEMLEFYTLRDTASGVEERVRFFSADLKEEPGDGVTMKLASNSPTTFVFENPTGTYPKRSTLTRVGNDGFHSHIELVDRKGKASTIDADWKKTN
jgi:hypothetical protein